jgi:aspartyl/asparaginyl beta-hydroxylase (cupin superfamily)
MRAGAANPFSTAQVVMDAKEAETLIPAELLRAADEAMRSRDLAAAAGILERYAKVATPGHDEWMRIATARRGNGDYVGALDAAGQAVRLRPDSFIALLTGGSLLHAMGRAEEAARAYKSAIQRAPQEDRLPPFLKYELANARRIVEQDRSWREDLPARLAAALHGANPAERERIERFKSAIEARAVQGDDTFEFQYPDLAPAGFLDPDRFPGVAELEAATPAIQAEFQALVRARAADLSPYVDHPANHVASADWTALGRTRKWSMLPLVQYGEPVAESAELCPETIRLYLRTQPPRVPGRSPNLAFSLLDPHTRIPAHTGVVNTRLVLHIPVLIPENCAIRVGEVTRPWKIGRALVFDDTMDHEAWNNSDHLRVILLGDLWRPELSPVEQRAVAVLMAREHVGA